MIAYLDTSVIIAILNDEPRSHLVADFLTAIESPPIVSEFAAAEVASALSRLVRIGALARDDAEGRLADFDAWRGAATEDLDIQHSDMRLAGILARRFDLMLRAPDALHAAICKRENFTLVTMDKRLAAAAEALGLHANLLN